MMNAMLIALQDISKDIKKYYIRTHKMGKGHEMDVWVVTPRMLLSKEVRQLNRLLGISKVNYFGNKNGFKNKLIIKNQ